MTRRTRLIAGSFGTRPGTRLPTRATRTRCTRIRARPAISCGRAESASQPDRLDAALGRGQSRQRRAELLQLGRGHDPRQRAFADLPDERELVSGGEVALRQRRFLPAPAGLLRRRQRGGLGRYDRRGRRRPGGAIWPAPSTGTRRSTSSSTASTAVSPITGTPPRATSTIACASSISPRRSARTTSAGCTTTGSAPGAFLHHVRRDDVRRGRLQAEVGRKRRRLPDAADRQHRPLERRLDAEHRHPERGDVRGLDRLAARLHRRHRDRQPERAHRRADHLQPRRHLHRLRTANRSPPSPSNQSGQ